MHLTASDLRETHEGDTTLQVLLEEKFMWCHYYRRDSLLYKDGLPCKHHKEDALNSS